MLLHHASLRGGNYVATATDTTPDAFTFTDQTSVALNTTITSAAITVSGINSPSPITVSNGTYDINGSGSFTSSAGTVNNGDTVRARHTSSALNSTPVNTQITIGGVSDTFTSTTLAAVGGGVIFNPNLNNISTLQEIFPGGALDDGNGVNNYAGGTAVLVSGFSRLGNTGTCIRLGYPNDEAGVELKVAPFAATTTLFCRKYEYYNIANDPNAPGASASPSWDYNWPAGLKTSRYFTHEDFTTDNGSGGWAYQSEKLIYYPEYQSGIGSDWQYARGFGSANYVLDKDGYYTTPYRDPNRAGGGWSVSQNDTPFNISTGNTLPWIRAGQWYKYESWLQLNTAPDVSDGIWRVWINDVQVVNMTDVNWVSVSRGCSNGLAGWRAMWFGGNMSSATFGHPGGTMYRYIDGIYLSTTLDR